MVRHAPWSWELAVYRGMLIATVTALAFLTWWNIGTW